MAKKRIHVYYSGAVHGVGFRFTARMEANELGLAGWAKNLRDGRVEVVCEGEEADLRKFLDDIANGILRNYISNADITWSDPQGDTSDFEIRF